MAFALLMLKARKINNRKQRLQIEKEHAVTIQSGESPKYSLADKYTRCIVDIKTKIQTCFNRIFSFPKNSWLHRTSVSSRTEGTLENYLLKSIIGFCAGFFLIYVFFMFFVVLLNFSLGIATLLCSIFGCILTVGLAFNQTIRQIVLLILPQFFSRRGRQALLAYAFILSLTGPCRNTLNNMGIMSESLACGQEQLKQAVKQIIDLIKKPFTAIKEAIKKIIVVVTQICKKIKEIFLTIKRIVMGIVRVIKSAFNFLGKIFNICSKKVGTPFQRCTKVFDNAVTDCYAKLGPMFDWLCAIAYVTKYVCYIVKPLDFICMLLDFINTSIIGVIVRKIKTFSRHVRSTFYVRIRFSHSFKFETTASKSMKEVTEGIVKEIKERTKKLNEIFNIVSALTSLFFFVIVLKTIVYRHKFMTNERFKNKYITNSFREIDFRRAQMEKETILPLNQREMSKYVNITSIRLVKRERKDLFQSLAILSTATFEIGIHVLYDYCLWWILATIRFYGKYANSVEVPRTVGLNVSGKGFVANLIRSVIQAFNPLGTKMNIDTVPCLPDPIPPDIDKYIQIAFILLLCWFLAILEPYGLRLRIYVMNYYYPGRAKERAIWLYNHILRNRSSFLKFARRQLKRKFIGRDAKEEKITCIEFFRSRINNSFLRFIFGSCLGPDRQDACVLCAQVFRPGDEKQPIRCSTPGCPGIYCEPCFTDLQNLCTICLDPIQYGDLSDIDEEKDSSEDENSSKYKRRVSSKEEMKVETNTDNKKDEEDTDTIEEATTRNTAGEQTLLNLSSSIPSSDFSDSDNSTEYSYSYQYNKTYSEVQTKFRDSFVDLEQQKIPDYVSMDTFQDYLFHPQDDNLTVNESEEQVKNIFLDTSSEEEKALERNPLLKSRNKPNHKTIRKIFLSTSSSETETEIISVESQANEYVRHYKKANRRRVNKWLKGRAMSHTKKTYHKEELIPLLTLQQSDEESTESSEHPKTITIYSKTSSTESLESEENHEERINTYSSIDNTVQYSTDKNSKLNYLFPNVRYLEVNEQPVRSSNSSYLNTSRTSTERTIRNRRQQSSPSSNSLSDVIFSLENVEENTKLYKEKIRRYYKSIPQLHHDPKTDKKNKIISFFSKLLGNL